MRGRSTLLFPDGLPGFSELRRFLLLTHPSYSPPFELLQSEQEPSIGFYLIDPSAVDPGYVPVVPPPDRRELLLQHGDTLAVRLMVTLHPESEGSTVNFAAPILLNLTAGVGRQVILETDEYPLQAPLLPATLSNDRQRAG